MHDNHIKYFGDEATEFPWKTEVMATLVTRQNLWDMDPEQ